MSQLASIRGIFYCYVAPGKAYLIWALHRHLAVNSSWRLLEGRGSLSTVKWDFLGGIKSESRKHSAHWKYYQAEWGLCCGQWVNVDLLSVVCDSHSCDPAGLILEKQKVVSHSGRKSWKHSAPVPFLESLSHLSSWLFHSSSCQHFQLYFEKGSQYPLQLSVDGRWYSLGHPAVLRPLRKSSMPDISCVDSKESIVLFK